MFLDQQWFAIQITMSALFGLLILFGLSNIVLYSAQICQNAIIIAYYLYSMVLLGFSVWQIWLTNDADGILFDLEYQAANAIVQNCEICVSLCQSLAFFRLGSFLAKYQSAPNYQMHQTVTKRALFIGLTLFNLIYLGYFLLLAICNKDEDNLKVKLVGLEFGCWLVDTSIQVVLICSICYTVRVLKDIYPSQSPGSPIKAEVANMQTLAAIYFFALAFKTVFEFVLFYAALLETQDLNLLKYLVVVLPFVWDGLPMLAIFNLHRKSFSLTNQESEPESTENNETRMPHMQSWLESQQSKTADERKQILIDKTRKQLQDDDSLHYQSGNNLSSNWDQEFSYDQLDLETVPDQNQGKPPIKSSRKRSSQMIGYQQVISGLFSKGKSMSVFDLPLSIGHQPEADGQAQFNVVGFVPKQTQKLKLQTQQIDSQQLQILEPDSSELNQTVDQTINLAHSARPQGQSTGTKQQSHHNEICLDESVRL